MVADSVQLLKFGVNSHGKSWKRSWTFLLSLKLQSRKM